MNPDQSAPQARANSPSIHFRGYEARHILGSQGRSERRLSHATAQHVEADTGTRPPCAPAVPFQSRPPVSHVSFCVPGSVPPPLLLVVGGRSGIVPHAAPGTFWHCGLGVPTRLVGIAPLPPAAAAPATRSHSVHTVSSRARKRLLSPAHFRGPLPAVLAAVRTGREYHQPAS